MRRIDGIVTLVASDMDGTLLDGEKQFPPDFARIFSLLQQKKIRFVAASGRSFATLRHNFAQVLGEQAANGMDYICDNGAFFVEGGKVSSISAMDPRVLREMIRCCRQIEDIQLLLCGVHGTYHLPYTPIFAGKAKSYYINHREVEDLEQVEDVIFKVAICDLRGPQNNSFPILAPRFGDMLGIQISGPQWMDVMNPGVDKGQALAQLQRALGVSPQQTMVFGDFCNDIGLLRQAYYSFAMANGHPEVLRAGRYLAGSNVQYGVTQALQAYLLDGMPLPGKNPHFVPKNGATT